MNEQTIRGFQLAATKSSFHLKPWTSETSHHDRVLQIPNTESMSIVNDCFIPLTLKIIGCANIVTGITSIVLTEMCVLWLKKAAEPLVQKVCNFMLLLAYSAPVRCIDPHFSNLNDVLNSFKILVYIMFIIKCTNIRQVKDYFIILCGIAYYKPQYHIE